MSYARWSGTEGVYNKRLQLGGMEGVLNSFLLLAVRV